jgi:hypothetical protein
VKAAVGADHHAASERPQVEALVVERQPGLERGRGEEMEAPVEPEAVELVRSRPTADVVRAFEHERAQAGLAQLLRAGEAGYAGADDEDVVHDHPIGSGAPDLNFPQSRIR